MSLKRECFRRRINYIAGVSSELLAPALRLWAGFLAGNRSLPPSQWRRGVLLGADHIGDVLYRTASLDALHRGLPDCDWYFAAAPPAMELLETNPNLAGCIPMSLSTSSAGINRSLVSELRERKFDVAVCYDTVAYSRALVIATLARIPARTGYVHKGLSGLVTHPIPIRYPQPYPAYFRDLVSQLTGRQPNWALRPVVRVTEADREIAEQVRQQLGLNGKEPVVACFPFTRQNVPIWPSEYFADALDRIVADTGSVIVVCGTMADREGLEKLRSSCSSSSVICAGELGLRALAVFIKRASVVLTSDSGPRHIANAMGTPVVFIRNLWSNRVETGVYCDSEVDVCGSEEYLDNDRQLEILKSIDPKTVAAAVVGVIRGQ